MDKPIPLIDIVMILVSNESETRGEPNPVKLKNLNDWCNEIAATEQIAGSAGLDIQINDYGVIQVKVAGREDEVSTMFTFHGLWG